MLSSVHEEIWSRMAEDLRGRQGRGSRDRGRVGILPWGERGRGGEKEAEGGVSLGKM